MTTAAIFLLLTLPWIHPFTLGPTNSVVPLLVSWACAAALALVGRPGLCPAPAGPQRPLVQPARAGGGAGKSLGESSN